MSQSTTKHPTWMPPDKLRLEIGWKGEYALFRAAQASHSTTHPEIDPLCKTCEVIHRNLIRLANEGENV